MTSCCKNIFLPKKAKILSVKKPTDSERHFTLRMADQSQMRFAPGQLLEVSLMGFGEIPIGFASSPTRKNTFDIVIRTVGRVSKAVNKLEKGDEIFVRGPLGNGFDVEKLKGHDILIVAGGIGLCPTRSLIQYIIDKRKDFNRFTIFYGTKSPEQQLFLEDLGRWRIADDVDYFETVDKADPGVWNGNIGVITSLFNKTTISPDARVIICGPPVMFKFVIMELNKIGVKHENIFLDMERRMKCGVGKCGHCQINDKYVCMDGPVFSYADIEKLEEAL
jgi:sulfhydrogenase subunit gamma (sulfur reductase)